MNEERKKEFLLKWRDIFEADCKLNANTTVTSSRTITDTEISRIGEHLFSWFESYRIITNEERLAFILVATQGHFRNCQDWATEIIRRIEKEV